MTDNVQKSRKMTGAYKSFDAADHAQWDEPGRTSFIKYLEKALPQYKHIDNPNKHGIDILSLSDKGEVIVAWEIEVRHGNWKTDASFPFNEINCIERKDHQWKRSDSFVALIPFKLAKKYKVYYVQLNKPLTKAVVIDGDIILDYPLKQWDNRKAQGEYVRQVPVNKTFQISLVK
jgi:hypothetical protein